MKNNKITSREENFADWYTDVVSASRLARYSNVKGCVILEPNGCALWDNIVENMDKLFKETGHKNVKLPMFIPEGLLNKESELVNGFAPEVAWVTQGGSKTLEERLCVRPTSETLFSDYYSEIVKSYKDLPIKYNQWCSVVRWEKETRPFLRSREFFWQEGHTVHATSEEAEKETNENDKNKENILDSKKRELESLKLQSNPNYARIEALQNEITVLEKEVKSEEKTHEELKDENISAEKVEFEKSDDETLVENADYINIRAEAIKRLNDDEPGLESKVLPSIYEAKVSEYMQKVRNERIQNRSIEDIKFDLYKQDRTLTDEVTDKEFDKKSDKIDEYENAATMYLEKENEILDRSLQEENDFKAMLNELDNNPDLDLSDYEKMLEELNKQTILTEEEKEELTAEIETRKLA